MAEEETPCQKERWNSCCCSCEWQYVDRSHPGTDGKSCTNTRGYICAEPNLGYHSEWFEHGMCECWNQRPDRPEEDDTNDIRHYEIEQWDARYTKRDSMPSYWRLKRKG